MDHRQLERQEDLEDFHQMLGLDVRGVLPALAGQIVEDARKFVSSYGLLRLHVCSNRVAQSFLLHVGLSHAASKHASPTVLLRAWATSSIVRKLN